MVAAWTVIIRESIVPQCDLIYESVSMVVTAE